MEGVKVLRSTQIIILGICVAFAAIISSVIISKGNRRCKQSGDNE
ncbi:MAG: hypothetical protein Q8N91_04415 [Candidatus Omnitrophota bacterium]|nr:hypothetical protein [Candidatus Omnitrophota bacterium]